MQLLFWSGDDEVGETQEAFLILYRDQYTVLWHLVRLRELDRYSFIFPKLIFTVDSTLEMFIK